MENNFKKTPLNIDINFICQFFKDLEYLAPGSDQETLKALHFIPKLSAKSQLLDIGCGTGRQTFTLAEHCDAHITAIDLSPDILDEFIQKEAYKKYQHRMDVQQASMLELPFKKEQFDVLWSEGAIYNIGFEKGVKEWHSFLKEDGYLVVSEATWLTDKRPAILQSYGEQNFPEITSINENLLRLEKAGYIPMGHFVMQKESWLTHYYRPVQEQMKRYERKYANEPAVLDFLNNLSTEIKMYEQYHDYYGYVFYIAQKKTKKGFPIDLFYLF
jgi:SAM-dependent methyltransferase